MKKALLLLNMGGANNLDDVEIFLTNMSESRHFASLQLSFVRKFQACKANLTRLILR